MRQRAETRSEATIGNGTETAAASVEARASQARLAVDDRQRIEQNIHDGIQQRLTALRIRLGLAAERFADRDDQDAADTLLGFGDQVEEAIDELREVAHGVYPHLLAMDGLAPALMAAAARSAHPVTVEADGVGRYPRQIENAVYFSVLAALDNAAKYAGRGPVTVTVWDADERLHFTVIDDGQGFHVNGSPAGGGLANMRDRLAAVAGTLQVKSSQTDGTRITGTVPGTSPARSRPRPPRRPPPTPISKPPPTPGGGSMPADGAFRPI
jgi:signal transduction histidine kinase